MKLTPQQEMEIFPLLDKALELPAGKGILRECSQSRADYLTRIITGMVYDTAIESIEMYDKSHALYGLGSYGKIWAEPHERGLLVSRLRTPLLTLAWQLIGVAATQERAELTTEHISRARQRLSRFQRKYPEIMNKVWLATDTTPIIAYYGEVTEEQTLVVDIDIDPTKNIQVSDHDKQLARMRNLRGTKE